MFEEDEIKEEMMKKRVLETVIIGFALLMTGCLADVSETSILNSLGMTAGLFCAMPKATGGQGEK